MKRRTFVAQATAAVVATTWPDWLRRAFAADADCPPGAAGLGAARPWLEIVSTAYRRARSVGKPLLVLVVPDGAERWNRGTIFGEVLNHGGDQVMATLALTEVTCAPVAAVKALIPSLTAREPMMIVIETDALPAHATPVEVQLPEPVNGREPDDFEQRMARENALVEQRIDIMGAALRKALAPDAATVARRARLQEARLSPSQLLAVRNAFASATPATADLDTGAALVHAAILSGPQASRAPLLHALADAGRARLCEQRVPGSRWANGGGCGTSIEWLPGEKQPDDHWAVACGMGHVPGKSRRFLDFLTADGKWSKGL